jgi:hypothetical protein
MASFVVTCTSGLCPSPFAGTYIQEATGLFTKDSYKITKDDGRESYTARGPVGLRFTLSPAGALNEFAGTETYNTIRNITNNGIGKRQIKAVYIPAPAAEPPAAVPSPAGLGVHGVPQPDPSTTKPDPAHAKVAETKGPIEQKTSVPSGPPLAVPQTPPASSSSSDPPPPVPSSSVQHSSSAPPPPASSSARGMPTSSIVAIVLACIVGLIILLLLTSFYFSGKQSAHYQRRIRHAQRRY